MPEQKQKVAHMREPHDQLEKERTTVRRCDVILSHGWSEREQDREDTHQPYGS